MGTIIQEELFIKSSNMLCSYSIGFMCIVQGKSCTFWFLKDGNMTIIGGTFM